MKKLIKILVVLVVVGGACFGGAFGVSLLLIKPQPQQAAATQPAAPPHAATEPGPGSEIAIRQRELDDLVREVRARQSACKLREDRLDERERRLQIAQDLLKKDAQELENLRLQLVAPLTQAREAQSELKKLRVVVAQQEKTNLKKTAQVYEKMEPVEAARILEGMFGSAQEDDAAKLVHFMTDRSAARVLGAITNKATAAKLTEKLKRIQEEG